MAFYQLYNFTTADQFINDLRDFAALNGWAIDFSGVYSGHNRVHAHKGAMHFEVYWASTSAVTMVACTGYNSGATPMAQPGFSAVKSFSYLPLATLGKYCFVSTGNALWIGYHNQALGTVFWAWGGIFTITSKIGAWNDGMCITNVSNTLMLNSYCYGASSGNAQLLINGAWTGTAAANGLMGSASSFSALATKQPFEYNAGILPIPVTLFIGLATDGTKMQPVGFAPGLYQCCGTGIYNVADEIIIGADTYLIMPAQASADIGSYQGDFLFKLGA